MISLQVPHTNDLTALALTNSSLHAIVTPLIYSRFDIVWPDALTLTEPRTGVDALTYGLATLVMREDIFENAMLERKDPGHGACQSFACKGCGSINYVNKVQTANGGRPRRGNFFSQFTKKFSLGNGPPDLVQEYLVTKEGGKMLGTLVALSIARMPNLETFIWDMPTGILRDIWISLSSLGDYRPSKLQKVFIRFHNNKKALEDSGLVRSPSTSNQQPLPPGVLQNVPQLPVSSSSLKESKFTVSNHHVESPNFSILPPLRSISAIAIDELANLNELSVLVGSSLDRLRELRVGMAPEIHSSGLPLDCTAVKTMVNGGTLALLFNELRDSWRKPLLESPISVGQVSPLTTAPPLPHDNALPTQWPNADMMESVSSITANSTAAFVGPVKTSVPGVNIASIDPALTQVSEPNIRLMDSLPRQCQAAGSTEQNLMLRPKTLGEAPSSPSKETNGHFDEGQAMGTGTARSSVASSPRRFKLETLEFERHTLNTGILTRVIDWSCLTSLTLLQCIHTDALWSTLRTQYAPLARPKSLVLSIPTVSLGKKMGPHPHLRRMPPSPHSSDDSQPSYRINLKHLHTNTVSVSLLTFLKETLAPNSLQSLFLQDRSDYVSAVTVSQIYKGPLKRHRGSLTKVLLNSVQGPPDGRTRSISARKWMLNREVLTHMISPGKMPKLRELSICLEYKDWHFFLQQLPNLRELRSLHIPFIADHVYGSNLSLKELAMGVVDVVNLRQECELAYLGVSTKCFEVVETKVRKAKKKSANAEGATDIYDTDNSSSEAPSINGDSDADDDNGDGDDDGNAQHHHATGTAAPANAENEEVAATLEVEDSTTSSSDEDLGMAREKQVKMKLREILFYDDKISIFKARHGKL